MGERDGARTTDGEAGGGGEEKGGWEGRASLSAHCDSTEHNDWQGCEIRDAMDAFAEHNPYHPRRTPEKK